MLDVLLVNAHCNAFQSSGPFKDFLVPMPPINLAYLASYAEKCNLKVAIHDDFFYKGDTEKFVKELLKHKPLVVGFSTYTSSVMGRVEQLVLLIREILPSTKIVMGNIHANHFAKDVLENNLADFVVMGEGEITLSELCLAVKSGQEWQNILGIAYCRNGVFIKNEPRPYIEDLDLIPFPAWHLLPITEYDTFLFCKKESPATLISGSRGCPFRCSFCSLFIQGGSRRVRSVNNIVNEIEYFNTKYGIKQFSFVDPMFPFSAEEGISFCRELKRRGLDKKIAWVTETRVDVINNEMAEAMKSSGCKMVMFGIESGSNETVKKLKKKFDIQKTYKALNICKNVGLQTTGFFIIGLPDETAEDIEETIRFSLSLPLTFAKYNVFVPYPGTLLYEELYAQGLLREDLMRRWECYSTIPTIKTPPVYKYSNVAPEYVIKAQFHAFIRFYFRFKKMIELVPSFKMKDIISICKLIIGTFLGLIQKQIFFKKN